MYSGIIVGRYKLWVWTLIFLALELFLLAFIIAAITSTWVYSDFKGVSTTYDVTNNYQFSGSSFEGYIGSCKSGCENRQTYKQLSDDMCEFPDNTDKSLCSSFTDLASAAAGKVLCDIGTIIGLVVWFISFACFLRNCNCFYCTHVFSVCSCLCYYIGSLIWFGLSAASFSSCSSFPSDGSKAIFCASVGPGLTIVAMIGFPPIVALYLAVALKAYPRRLSIVSDNIPPSIPAPNPHVFQPGVNVPYVMAPGQYPYYPAPQAPVYIQAAYPAPQGVVYSENQGTDRNQGLPPNPAQGGNVYPNIYAQPALMTREDVNDKNSKID